MSRRPTLCIRPAAQRPLMLPTPLPDFCLPFYRELRLPVHAEAEQARSCSQRTFILVGKKTIPKYTQRQVVISSVRRIKQRKILVRGAEDSARTIRIGPHILHPKEQFNINLSP